MLVTYCLYAIYTYITVRCPLNLEQKSSSKQQQTAPKIILSKSKTEKSNKPNKGNKPNPNSNSNELIKFFDPLPNHIQHQIISITKTFYYTIKNIK